jgi:hypothetical protein
MKKDRLHNEAPIICQAAFTRMSKLWLILAVIAVVAVGCDSGYVKRTEKFATRVKGVVSPDVLQAWATNLITKTPVVRRQPVEIRKADIPEYIRAIYNEYPEDVEVVSGDAGTCVQICYGSGFGHWGLYIGDPSFKHESSEQFYVVPWKPGIYFWDGP